MSEYITQDAALDRVGSVGGSGIIHNYGENDDKWLTFWLDKQLFGFSVKNVEQIVRMMPITTVPYYPAYAKGIINLRGAVIPVIDLRVLLDMVDVQDTAQTCIVIVDLSGLQVGFVVDGVDSVLDIPGNAICKPPMVNENKENKYLTGIATINDHDGNNRNVLLVDMEKILKKDEVDMFVLSDA